MRTLAVLSLLFLSPLGLASPSEKRVELSKEQERAVLAAYHALKAPEPQSKKIEKLPDNEPLAKIDVSDRIRSASFGHRTWLWVPAHARHYYVEYGPSTNTPPALFGPFAVHVGEDRQGGRPQRESPGRPAGN